MGEPACPCRQAGAGRGAGEGKNQKEST